MPVAQAELPAHELELGLLGLVEGARGIPVRARVDHAAVEHRLVEIVADVVVVLAVAERARDALQIQDAGAHRMRDQHPALAHGLAEPRPQDAIDRLVERRRVPPALDVRLADAERAVAEHAAVEPIVVDLDVPGPITADGDARGGEEVAAQLRGVPRIEPTTTVCERCWWRTWAHLPGRGDSERRRSRSRGAGSRAPENIHAKVRATARRPTGRPRRALAREGQRRRTAPAAAITPWTRR